MNRDRVINQTRIIDSRKEALAWLAEHGVKLTGHAEDVEATFEMSLHAARLCPGAADATSMMEQFARALLPDIVKAATECCRNDIAIARAAIEAELATLDAPT